jgi:hypothetical protein
VYVPYLRIVVTKPTARHREKHQNGKRLPVHDLQEDGELGCGESLHYIRIGAKPTRKVDIEVVGKIVLAVNLGS